MSCSGRWAPFPEAALAIDAISAGLLYTNLQYCVHHLAPAPPHRDELRLSQHIFKGRFMYADEVFTMYKICSGCSHTHCTGSEPPAE